MKLVKFPLERMRFGFVILPVGAEFFLGWYSLLIIWGREK
jgi:hypothetical protein